MDQPYTDNEWRAFCRECGIDPDQVIIPVEIADRWMALRKMIREFGRERSEEASDG